MMTINIQGTDYKVKQTIRSLFLWEEIAGRQFEIKTTLDNYIYYYCLILANNPDTTLTWDQFLDAIDDDPTVVIRMGKILVTTQNVEKIFESNEKDAEGKKKKLSVSELFALLTLDFGIAPDYVLDKMEYYEITAMMKHAHLKHKEAWERARLIAYVTAQVQSRRRLKITDICHFTWDEENGAVSGDAMTQEEFDSTFAEMERMIAEGLI